MLKISSTAADLYLIDFGSVGKLTKAEQCRLIDTMLVTAKFTTLDVLIPTEDPSSQMSLSKTLLNASMVVKVQGVAGFDADKRTQFRKTASLLASTTKDETIRGKASELAEMKIDAATINKMAELALQIRKIAEDTDKKLKKEKGIKRSELACFYRSFHKLTCAQQVQLLPKLQDPVVQQQHKDNLVHSKQFLQQLMQVCEVKQLPDIDRFAAMILDYSVYLNFGQLFLDFVRVSSDIGTCTSNSTLMFGRGIAYLGNSVIEMFTACADKKQCPNVPFNSVIEKQLARSPAQLVNFLAHRPVCQALF